VVVTFDLCPGTLGAVDPDRIILKKIVLTGFPVKVKKRSAVVKHMFYNPDDVKWFKVRRFGRNGEFFRVFVVDGSGIHTVPVGVWQPAELTTKMGVVGHIKDSVGTHGLMKVRFSKVIKQSDTVCLQLFKRVYPKFVDGEAGTVTCV
jgi:pre-rRNA-processing protein TSR1